MLYEVITLALTPARTFADPPNGADYMIITRTGFGARAVESYMVEKEIPYQFVGGTSLLQTAHVKDLLCLVRAADSHSDELV